VFREPAEGARADGALLLGVLIVGEAVPVPREVGVLADGVPAPGALAEGFRVFGDQADGVPAEALPLDGVRAAGVRGVPAPLRTPSVGRRGLFTEGVAALGVVGLEAPVVAVPRPGVATLGVPLPARVLGVVVLDVPFPVRVLGVATRGVPKAPRLLPGAVLAVSLPGVPRRTAPPFLEPSVPGWATVLPAPLGLCLVTPFPAAELLPLGLA
jgi:hypothetical protein